MSGMTYYLDLNRSDFSTDEDYLAERFKRGFAAGYTFKQCVDHWYQDFEAALLGKKEEEEKKDDGNIDDRCNSLAANP